MVLFSYYMDVAVHGLVFLASLGIIWFFADVLVNAVGRISRRYCKSGFLTAFFVLGFLTSISELSVAANSVLSSVQGISAGNLVGASFVLLLCIIPLLAVIGKGFRLNEAVSGKVLAMILIAAALPALLMLDGSVTRTEGFLSLLAYGTVAFALYRRRQPINACDPDVETDVFGRMRATAGDVIRILVGAVAVFLAAHFLVTEAAYFAAIVSVPDSLIGLLMLSLGTNVPEIVIAVRAVARGRSDIAFGDYLGSAVMNTFIFGMLASVSGFFAVEASEFVITAALMATGLFLLFLFSTSRNMLSRGEGAFLLLFYVAFVVLQVWSMLRLADF